MAVPGQPFELPDLPADAKEAVAAVAGMSSTHQESFIADSPRLTTDAQALAMNLQADRPLLTLQPGDEARKVAFKRIIIHTGSTSAAQRTDSLRAHLQVLQTFSQTSVAKDVREITFCTHHAKCPFPKSSHQPAGTFQATDPASTNPAAETAWTAFLAQITTIAIEGTSTWLDMQSLNTFLLRMPSLRSLHIAHATTLDESIPLATLPALNCTAIALTDFDMHPDALSTFLKTQNTHHLHTLTVLGDSRLLSASGANLSAPASFHGIMTELASCRARSALVALHRFEITYPVEAAEWDSRVAQYMYAAFPSEVAPRPGVFGVRRRAGGGIESTWWLNVDEEGKGREEVRDACGEMEE